MRKKKAPSSPLPSEALRGDTVSSIRQRPAKVFVDVPPPSSAAEEGERRREVAMMATPFAWHGQSLHPFSIGRECDWSAHRAMVGAPPLQSVFSHISAFLGDAVRILWFCAHGEDEWLGRGVGVEIEKRIREWAEENIAPGEQGEVLNLALQIYNRAHETRAVAKPEGRSGDDAGN